MVLPTSDEVTGEALSRYLKGLRSLEQLSLNGGKWGGPTLAELARLPSLKSVMIDRVSLTTEAFTHLAAVRNLQELTVHMCGVTDACLVPLADCKGLRVLRLNNNRGVTNDGMKHLAGLPTLEDLTLVGTSANGACLASLKGLASLKKLMLSGPASDDDLAHLAGMKSLEALDLSNFLISPRGVAHLAKLKGLKRLYLSEVGLVDDDLKQLAALTGLVYVALGRNNKLTGAGLTHLAALQNMESLDLFSCPKVGDDGVAALKGLGRLTHLGLGETGITDASVEHFKAFRALKNVTVTGTKMTPEGAKKLKDALGAGAQVNR
jgi:hypothetical protein